MACCSNFNLCKLWKTSDIPTYNFVFCDLKKTNSFVSKFTMEIIINTSPDVCLVYNKKIKHYSIHFKVFWEKSIFLIGISDTSETALEKDSSLFICVKPIVKYCNLYTILFCVHRVCNSHTVKLIFSCQLVGNQRKNTPPLGYEKLTLTATSCGLNMLKKAVLF